MSYYYLSLEAHQLSTFNAKRTTTFKNGVNCEGRDYSNFKKDEYKQIFAGRQCLHFYSFAV